MEPSPLAPADEERGMPPREPLFSLWHLFALTAGVAVVMALDRVLREPLARGIESSIYTHPIVYGAYAFLSGLTVGGLAIVVAERLRGRIVLIEPGHGLLLLGALGAVQGIIGQWVTSWDRSSWTNLIGWWWYVQLPFFVVSASVAVGCAWFVAPRFYWRVFFLLWGLLAFLWLIYVAVLIDLIRVATTPLEPNAIGPLLQLVAFGSVGLPAAIDLRREPRPDWLHWVGIGLTLAQQLTGLIVFGLDAYYRHIG